MARHHNTRLRCPRCQLHQTNCICTELPELSCPISVVVVQHWKESRRPTSTGSLLSKLLNTGSLRLHGHRDAPFDPTGLDLPDTWLVFPVREGPVLIPERSPRQLVLVDGNWNQASRMARRIPAVACLPRYPLLQPARPIQRLREPPEAGARSTMEAASDALRQCGHTRIADELDRAHERFVAATLYQRGVRNRDHPASSV